MNSRLALAGFASGVLLLLAGAARADDNEKAAANLARAQFEQLKRLAGEWAGQAAHGEVQHEATVSYKVTSGGSTVMETQFGGTSHEMITMYHLDGDALVLTHYCAIGNQPRMKAAPTGDPKRLEFRFLGGTNLDAAKDMHMHEATIELVSDDQIRSAWTLYAGGKPASTAKFELKRKK